MPRVLSFVQVQKCDSTLSKHANLWDSRRGESSYIPAFTSIADINSQCFRLAIVNGTAGCCVFVSICMERPCSVQLAVGNTCHEKCQSAQGGVFFRFAAQIVRDVVCCAVKNRSRAGSSLIVIAVTPTVCESTTAH